MLETEEERDLTQGGNGKALLLALELELLQRHYLARCLVPRPDHVSRLTHAAKSAKFGREVRRQNRKKKRNGGKERMYANKEKIVFCAYKCDEQIVNTENS